ncbi:phosphate ABC transporter permease [Cylindrospermopsis raciborskii S07]|uniref:phosphate ABC transporter permease n=1 Tax=Cylindrospermopsis raciborskii TaxID=77022 RepID=UPI000C9DA76F|nr:phosphate ABC transporter permease [Cylindrospermopsis raciborskii]PNK04944.1 phosphate ABC transporter permease [Cylindrospermopsis raciborskii S14]PNK07568.1 phosphate ABC transporter permease [Cylindrospermopsis raciborskii S10]PNK08080.1 phosphate ABC transporter permease [Cylindrospermopsis raciborskii S07]PNK17385.1 phosphate ABC transporter permease [Cylindrospermopsis raciborskii S06]PNK19089.1 phosphate ABC transporter permease [Cylindrospermopsis raciborskii S05]
MIIPLTRQKLEQIIPLIGSGDQYKYYWGKFNNFLQRLLISVVTVVVILLIKNLLQLDFGLVFVFGVFGGFFWLWYPVYQASIRNFKYRSYKYGGFFRGRIVDWWITEKVIGKQETVNNRGELVIIENREKRINLEIGDNTGFSIEFDAPLRSTHKAIARGQVAEMLVMSNSADLSTIEDFSNIYIPSRNLWVSDYPYVREDLFNEVSRRIRSSPRGRSQTPKYRAKPQDDYYDDES